MRVVIIVLVTLHSVLLSPPTSAQQDYPVSGTIRGENIWLRVDLTEDTEILAYLQRGDQIRVTGTARVGDRDSFYPIEVVETGETGLVRALAIDPRSLTTLDALPEVLVNEPAAGDLAIDEEPSRRGRNNRETPVAETEVVDESPAAEAPAEEESLPVNPGDSPKDAVPVGTVLRPASLAVVVSDAVFLVKVGSVAPESGYKFMKVTARINNIGTEERRLGRKNFSAQDVETGAALDSVAVPTEEEMPHGNVAPGGFVVGSVYFEVPSGIKEAIVTFTPDLGSLNKSFYWRVPLSQ